MKSERRHELKENELAHVIDSLRHFLAGRGKPLGMAVLVIAAVVVVGGLAMRTRAVAKEDRWRRLSQLSFTDVETGKKSLEALIALTDGASDDGFVLSGLMDQGLQALRLSQKSELPPDRELNEIAKRAFEQLVAKYPRNPIALGLAYCGLATVEENLFVLTGDSNHRMRAEKHLTAVIENDLLNGMPYQRLAIERRDKLDSTFADVLFVMLETDSSASADPAKPAITIEEIYQQMPKEIRDQLSKEIQEKIVEDAKPKNLPAVPIVIEPTKDAPSTDGSNETDTDAPGGSHTP